MSDLAGSLVTGGVGLVGFAASAVTLAKFIISTPVKVDNRREEELGKDVVLGFDLASFGQEPVDFFINAMKQQSKLDIVHKRGDDEVGMHSALESKDGEEHKSGTMIFYLVGGSEEVLEEIHREKEYKAGNVAKKKKKEFNSGERIELIMYELRQLAVRDPNALSYGDDGDQFPHPFDTEEHGSLLQQGLHTKLITDCFPLHDTEERKALMDTWVKKWHSPQPMKTIRDYFGNEVGFYFAFIGMYTWWLIIPTVLGVVVFFAEHMAIERYGVYARGLYSLFITSWATAFLKYWKRQESTLLIEWKVENAAPQELEPARPEFEGERRYDEVEGEYYTYFSSTKRMKRYGVTSAAISAVLFVVVGIMFAYYYIEEWVTDICTEENGWDGMYAYVPMIPSMIYSIVVMVLDASFSDLADKLTKFENHRTDSDFTNALVLKLASFYFVNNFGLLFFIAFWSLDMDRLQHTMSSMLITRQLVGNAQEQLIPYFTATSQLKTEAGKKAKEAHSKEAAVLSKVDAELLHPDYDGTFDDYLELFVQFGQVTLFASAYPLAALCCIVNNVMEIRSDAFKLCMTFRRSRRKRSTGIGTWLLAFNALGYLSVVTNCAIFGLHSGMLDELFPRLSVTDILLCVAVMEHAMLAVKVVIEMAIPDTPSVVKEKQRIQRAKMRRNAALHAELSSRKQQNEETSEPSEKPVEVPETKEDLKQWMEKERDRRSKLEEEVKGLNQLYMDWIRNEQEKRRNLEKQLAECHQEKKDE